MSPYGSAAVVNLWCCGSTIQFRLCDLKMVNNKLDLDLLKNFTESVADIYHIWLNYYDLLSLAIWMEYHLFSFI